MLRSQLSNLNNQISKINAELEHIEQLIKKEETFQKIAIKAFESLSKNYPKDQDFLLSLEKFDFLDSHYVGFFVNDILDSQKQVTAKISINKEKMKDLKVSEKEISDLSSRVHFSNVSLEPYRKIIEISNQIYLNCDEKKFLKIKNSNFLSRLFFNESETFIFDQYISLKQEFLNLNNSKKNYTSKLNLNADRFADIVIIGNALLGKKSSDEKQLKDLSAKLEQYNTLKSENSSLCKELSYNEGYRLISKIQNFIFKEVNQRIALVNLCFPHETENFKTSLSNLEILNEKKCKLKSKLSDVEYDLNRVARKIRKQRKSDGDGLFLAVGCGLFS